MGIPAPLGVAWPGTPATGDQANAALSGVITAVGPQLPMAVRGPMNLVLYASLVNALTVTAGSLSASVASGTSMANGQAINSVLVPAGTSFGSLSGTSISLLVPPICLSGRSKTAPLNQIHGLGSTSGLLGATVTGPQVSSGTTVSSIVRPAIAPANEIPSVAPYYSSLAAGQTGQVQLSAAVGADVATAGLQPYVFYRTGNAILAGGTDNAAFFTGAGITYTGSVQLERSFDGGSTWLLANIGGSGTEAVYAAGTPVSLTFGEPEKEVLYRLNCTALSSGNINFRISATGQAAESYGFGLLS